MQDDEDECWGACESSYSLSDDVSTFKEVENATEEFEVMISHPSTDLRGAISEVICVMQVELHSDSTRQDGVIAGNTNSMTQYSVAKMN